MKIQTKLNVGDIVYKKQKRKKRCEYCNTFLENEYEIYSKEIVIKSIQTYRSEKTNTIWYNSSNENQTKFNEGDIGKIIFLNEEEIYENN